MAFPQPPQSTKPALLPWGRVRETIRRVFGPRPDQRKRQTRARWVIEQFQIEKYLTPTRLLTEPDPSTAHQTPRGQSFVCIGFDLEYEMPEIDRLFPGSTITGIHADDTFTSVKPQSRTLVRGSTCHEMHHRSKEMQRIESHSADGVTVNFMFHHVNESLHHCLFDEIRRLLRADGFLFVAEDLVDSEKERQTIVWENRTLNQAITPHSTHRFRNAQEWENFFHEHGFEVLEDEANMPGRFSHGFFVLRKIPKKPGSDGSDNAQTIESSDDSIH